MSRRGGVYVLFRGREPIYIGRTGNLRSRIWAHASKQPDRVKVRHLMSVRSQRRLESALINRLRPRYNATIPIRSAWTRLSYGW